MIGDQSLVRTWRPQSFGRRPARQIDDPLVEPLWSGIRALAHVGRDEVELVDPGGEVQSWPEVASALRTALQADEAVIDGYLTTEVTAPSVGISEASLVEAPSPAQTARQMLWFGGSGKDRRKELIERLEAASGPTFGPGDAVGFVAVDLLSLDGLPLFDIPLLERKRLLDSALAEGDLIRRTIHVRPPLDIWFETWRTLRFRSVAFKTANSRYQPGAANDDWATSDIPRR